MNEYPIFIFAALLIFVYGLFSRFSEHSPISAAMVFVSVGIIVGPLGFDFVELGINSTVVHVIAELTLVLVLFIDASTIDVRLLIRQKNLPFRQLVPRKIRDAISVESGLNDGMALPPILACMAVLSTTPSENTGIYYWFFFTVKPARFWAE